MPTLSPIGADNPLGLLRGRSSGRRGSRDRTSLALQLRPPSLMGSPHLGFGRLAEFAPGLLRGTSSFNNSLHRCNALFLCPPGLLRLRHLGLGGSTEGSPARGSCR